MFLVKPISSGYFRKFLATIPSAEMTKAFIHTLFRFHIFLFSTAKFSYFVIFSVSHFGRLWVKRTAMSITSAVSFSLSM